MAQEHMEAHWRMTERALQLADDKLALGKYKAMYELLRKNLMREGATVGMLRTLVNVMETARY